jgi:hypothetical protein
MSNEQTKKCSKCRVLLPLSNFAKDPSRFGGRNARCRPCQAEHARNQLQRVITTTAYKERHKINQRRWASRNPEKVKAHQQAKKVPLGSHCEQCGASEKLHRHHPDYTKPLEVIILCVACHERTHHAAA